MRLDNVSGYFDVRVYNKTKQHDQRDVASQDQTISFGVSYRPENLPKEVSKYARAYTRKDGETAMFVTFKISKGCKFFEKQGGRVMAIDRPQHIELEGKRYECCLDFRELNGDPTRQEPYGYWVNGILIAEAQSDMFADLNDAAPATVAPVQLAQPETPADKAAATALGATADLAPDEVTSDLLF